LECDGKRSATTLWIKATATPHNGRKSIAASLCRRTPKYIRVTLIEASQSRLLYKLDYDFIPAVYGGAPELSIRIDWHCDC
jgi:hypothetical protein